MLTTTYSEIKLLAADLADQVRDKLPPGVATMLRAAFASNLPDLWNREAWPELCDHLEAVALDENQCFDLREGTANEMGDILAIIIGGDPRLTTAVKVIPKDQISRLDGRVNVVSPESAVWVDWQTPCPDLLAVADADLDAYALPWRFKLALAAYGASQLLLGTDPQRAALVRQMGDTDLSRQAVRIQSPWWRK